MSMSRKMRRAAARPASPARRPPPVRFAEVRAALDVANRLRDEGRIAEALDLCRRVLPIEPDHPEVHFTLATILERQGDAVGACQAYAKVVALAPEFLPGLINHAGLLSQVGDLGESIAVYGRALALEPHNPVVRHNIALVLTQARRHAEALPHYEWLASHSGQFADLTELAGARDRAGDVKGALRAYAAAMKLVPLTTPLHVSMARLEQVRGDREAARRHIEEALAADPHDGYAHLSKAQHFTAAEETGVEIARIEAALAATANRPVTIAASPLNFALARLLERRGDVDRAFAAYATANRLLAPLQVDDDEIREAEAEAQMREFTPERLAELSPHGSPSRKPLFVLGMPRSGTSLVEQMLASHPKVLGLGELELLPALAPMLRQPTPERVGRAARLYLDAYPPAASKAERVTDKSIGNFHHIGHILALFPNACLVACERHPMDVAWSIFTEYFGDNALVYAYDFERIVRHLRLHRRVMDHWARVLPGRILEVRYEHLVASPEAESRRLLAHAGLAFDPVVLSFHTSARAVRTASLEQVRQPIYMSSVGKWRKFAPHLRDLAAALEDLSEGYERAAGE
jgi:tetratricopeptide (TPR) repeat protein